MRGIILQTMKELVKYIQELHRQKLTKLEIQEICQAAGWSKADIWQAIAKVYKLPPPPVAPAAKLASLSTAAADQSTLPDKKPRQGSFSLWIAFEYILLFISLYVMAISLGLLWSVFVRRWFPDLELERYSSSYREHISMMLGSMAALVVSWPLFSLFFYDIKKKEISSPGIRDIISRKILIYLTLVVTFVVMTVNLITVINAFLSGSITTQFVALTTIILSISGTIFWYYLGQVRQDRALQQT